MGDAIFDVNVNKDVLSFERGFIVRQLGYGVTLSDFLEMRDAGNPTLLRANVADMVEDESILMSFDGKRSVSEWDPNKPNTGGGTPASLVSDEPGPATV